MSIVLRSAGCEGARTIIDHDGEPLTFGRALRTPKFWLLQVAATCSMSAMRWWVVVPLTAAGLTSSSLPKYIGLWPQALYIGAAWAWWATVGFSALNSPAAAICCVLIGRLIRWVWP